MRNKLSAFPCLFQRIILEKAVDHNEHNVRTMSYVCNRPCNVVLLPLQ